MEWAVSESSSVSQTLAVLSRGGMTSYWNCCRRISALAGPRQASLLAPRLSDSLRTAQSISIWTWNMAPALRNSILAPLVALLLYCHPFNIVANESLKKEIENKGCDLGTHCQDSDPILFCKHSCGLNISLLLFFSFSFIYFLSTFHTQRGAQRGAWAHNPDWDQDLNWDQ